MKDQWTDRLSQYLDGELAAPERTTLEAHLASCDVCRTTLEELRRVVTNARALDDRPPAADLWPAVAARIGLSPREQARPVVRRFSFTVPQLAAASVVLALLSAAAAWLIVRRGTVPTAPVAVAERAPVLLNASAYPGDARFDAQVADLERALARGRGRLDTATVRVIERNLRIIDRAIRGAQSALAADPANSYLNLHLAQQLRRTPDPLRGLYRHQGGRRPERDHGRDGAGRGHGAGRVGQRIAQVRYGGRDTREGARPYRLEQRQRSDSGDGGLGRPHRRNRERRHHAHSDRVRQRRGQHGQRRHHLRRDDQGRRPLSIWNA